MMFLNCNFVFLSRNIPKPYCSYKKKRPGKKNGFHHIKIVIMILFTYVLRR